MNWSYFENDTRHYLTKEVSLKIFHSILMTQEIDESTFVNNVWYLLNKKLPKCNLLVLRGLPNTGKSMVARSIAELFTHVSTIQGTSSFPFQNLLNVEIGLIEEPNFTLETLQTFKKLAEGTDTEVSVKYKPDQIVHRTPLIITSNKFDSNAPLHERHAFITRYPEYLFNKSSPFLQYVKKKINPIIWNVLFYEHCFSSLITDDGSSSDDNLCHILEEYEILTNRDADKENRRPSGFRTLSNSGSGSTVRVFSETDEEEQLPERKRKFRKLTYKPNYESDSELSDTEL
ncbi:nonstructural [Octopus vulgaris]|uniref:Nonstructural n=1 Tax=Octopus vulgaris TaxID=6645 RepID=A0AA36B6B4_OCTVU|nr:nonstructural [Octopus vulgaris]